VRAPVAFPPLNFFPPSRLFLGFSSREKGAPPVPVEGPSRSCESSSSLCGFDARLHRRAPYLNSGKSFFPPPTRSHPFRFFSRHVLGGHFSCLKIGRFFYQAQVLLLLLCVFFLCPLVVLWSFFRGRATISLFCTGRFPFAHPALFFLLKACCLSGP